jgi:hypothetical protein
MVPTSVSLLRQKCPLAQASISRPTFNGNVLGNVLEFQHKSRLAHRAILATAEHW